jgi:hypothetical protein
MKREEGGKGGDGAAKGKQAFKKWQAVERR